MFSYGFYFNEKRILMKFSHQIMVFVIFVDFICKSIVYIKKYKLILQLKFFIDFWTILKKKIIVVMIAKVKHGTILICIITSINFKFYGIIWLWTQMPLKLFIGQSMCWSGYPKHKLGFLGIKFVKTISPKPSLE